MTEQRPGRHNGIDRRPWNLRISPKTPYSVLTEPRSANLSSVIAQDMISNVKELASTVNWDKILADYSLCERRGKCRGKTAIERGIAQNMRLIAMQMGWGMDTPQAVFISGLFFSRVIDKNTTEKSARLRELNDPERKFVSEEARAATIGKISEEISELGRSKGILEYSLRGFAREKVSRSKSDQMIWQKAIDLLISGKTEEVEAILSNLPTRKLVSPRRKKMFVETHPIPKERAIVIFTNPQPIFPS